MIITRPAARRAARCSDGARSPTSGEPAESDRTTKCRYPLLARLLHPCRPVRPEPAGDDAAGQRGGLLARDPGGGAAADGGQQVEGEREDGAAHGQLLHQAAVSVEGGIDIGPAGAARPRRRRTQRDQVELQRRTRARSGAGLLSSACESRLPKVTGGPDRSRLSAAPGYPTPSRCWASASGTSTTIALTVPSAKPHRCGHLPTQPEPRHPWRTHSRPVTCSLGLGLPGRIRRRLICGPYMGRAWSPRPSR